MYSPQLLDHLMNPRNVGRIEHPDAEARVENPVCGDVLVLTLRLEDGRIAEACFQVQGCVPLIACASLLTERITGRTPAEAARITAAALVAGLGGIPPASTHAPELAVEALAVALATRAW